VLRLRFDDFTRATRSHTLPAPTADTAAVLVALQRLLRDCAGLIREQGITLIGVSLANLDNADALQLELPFDRRDTLSLDSALDRVRDRYGTSSITRGVLLGKDQGMTVPLLPD
jgi:DNA polymerase-4